MGCSVFARSAPASGLRLAVALFAASLAMSACGGERLGVIGKPVEAPEPAFYEGLGLAKFNGKAADAQMGAVALLLGVGTRVSISVAEELSASVLSARFERDGHVRLWGLDIDAAGGPVEAISTTPGEAPRQFILQNIRARSLGEQRVPLDLSQFPKAIARVTMPMVVAADVGTSADATLPVQAQFEEVPYVITFDVVAGEVTATVEAEEARVLFGSSAGFSIDSFSLASQLSNQRPL